MLHFKANTVIDFGVIHVCTHDVIHDDTVSLAKKKIIKNHKMMKISYATSSKLYPQAVFFFISNFLPNPFRLIYPCHTLLLCVFPSLKHNLLVRFLFFYFLFDPLRSFLVMLNTIFLTVKAFIGNM